MSKVTSEHIDGIMAASTFRVQKVGLKTCLVVCTLPSGFEITATSACVNPAEYSEDIGVSICNKKIADKLWELEGYRAQLESAPLDFKDRVRAEKDDLDAKRSKLLEFMKTERFTSLPETEQERMMKQYDVMGSYMSILRERISAFE
jgi:hypothetical protein